VAAVLRTFGHTATKPCAGTESADESTAPTGSGRTPGSTRAVERLPGWVLTYAPSVLPAVLMLFVGRYRLGAPSLGWDENATWLASRRSFSQLVGLAGNFDGVIAPYYMFMRVWTSIFGDSELALRTPSLLAMAVGVGLTGELGRRLFTPGVGLLGGLMLITVPQISRYAQDARVYGLAFMLTTLSTLLFYLALRRPGWARWIVYGVVVTLAGLAHIFGLLVLVGHAFAVGVRWWAGRDRALLRWLVVTAVAVLPVLPLAVLGLTQRGDQLDWIGPMRVGQVLTSPGDIFGSAAVGLFLIGLAYAARWPDGRLVGDFAVLVAAPPALLIGASFVTSSVWVPRYVMFVVPMIALLAAAALRGFRLRALLAVLLAAALGLPAQREVRGAASHHGPDFRAAAAIIAAHRQPGDGIVYGRTGTWSLRAGVDYYLRDRTTPRDLLLTRAAAEVNQLGAEQCADQVACLGATSRVWLLKLWQSGSPLDDAGPLAGTLGTDYRQARVWKAAKVTIVLYERRG
jgi:mannosyltransferase